MSGEPDVMTQLVATVAKIDEAHWETANRTLDLIGDLNTAIYGLRTQVMDLRARVEQLENNR